MQTRKTYIVRHGTSEQVGEVHLVRDGRGNIVETWTVVAVNKGNKDTRVTYDILGERDDYT